MQHVAQVHHPYQYQTTEHQASGTLAGRGKSQARGTNTTMLKDSKEGYLSQYVPKQGVQYYKDLAGNVKQVRQKLSSKTMTNRI